MFPYGFLRRPRDLSKLTAIWNWIWCYTTARSPLRDITLKPLSFTTTSRWLNSVIAEFTCIWRSTFFEYLPLMQLWALKMLGTFEQRDLGLPLLPQLLWADGLGLYLSLLQQWYLLLEHFLNGVFPKPLQVLRYGNPSAYLLNGPIEIHVLWSRWEWSEVKPIPCPKETGRRCNSTEIGVE